MSSLYDLFFGSQPKSVPQAIGFGNIGGAVGQYATTRDVAPIQQAADERKRLNKVGDYLINDSIPAEMAKAAYRGFTLPGRVFTGETQMDVYDPSTGEMVPNPQVVGDAAELAGLVTLGAGAIPADDTLRMGLKMQPALRKNYESPEFKSWFGDSKVIDDSGLPKTVYRGQSAVDWTTNEPLETLQRGVEFPAFHPGNPKEPGVNIAAFFTDNPDVANRFSTMYTPGNGSAPATFPVNLSIKNPFVIDAKGGKAGKFQFGEEGQPFRDAIRSGKYDGVIIKNTSDEGNLYIPLEPTQIKSVFNSGTYSKTDPRIMYGAGGGVAGVSATGGQLSEQDRNGS